MIASGAAGRCPGPLCGGIGEVERERRTGEANTAGVDSGTEGKSDSATAKDRDQPTVEQGKSVGMELKW